ncbi:MAG: ribosomal protein S18-alanine N-acetyltransferase [Bacillota bacterium]
MDRVVFLPLREECLNQVLEIEQVSFPTPWSRQSFLGELNDNAMAYYCVAMLDERVIGYGGMWLILDEAHITNVAVHPDYRGKRIGEGIMIHLMKQALIQGAYRMTLEVRPSNLSAIKLYQRMGFEAAGRRKGYYTDTKEDAIIMWKTLLCIETNDS